MKKSLDPAALLATLITRECAVHFRLLAVAFGATCSPWAVSEAVVDLLHWLGRERQAAVIVVTHDERMITGFDRVHHMTDSRITRDR